MRKRTCRTRWRSPRTRRSPTWRTGPAPPTSSKWRQPTASTPRLQLRRLEPGSTISARSPTVALGVSSLTVNEQTQMLATIDDNGLYHAGHIIKYWQLPAGPEQTPDVASHVVLTPAQDSQVQYAMEKTTVDGTGTDAAVGLGTGRSSARPARPRTSNPASSSARSRSTHWSSACSPVIRAPHRSTSHSTACRNWAAAASAVTGRPRSGTPSPRPSSTISRWKTSRTRCSPARRGTCSAPSPRRSRRRRPPPPSATPRRATASSPRPPAQAA